MPSDTFTRICPVCGKEVVHTSESSRNRADREKKQCKECAYEATRRTCRTEEFRREHAKRISDAWHAEDSVFQTEEYRKRLSDAQYARDPASYEKSRKSIREAWAREKECPTGRIERMSEANRREDVRKKRSESLARLYEEHPEKREMRSRITKDLMKDPDFKRRCTAPLIAAARRTGGTSKQEKQIAVILAKYGFVHKHVVGRWCVDFYNPNTDTVVEFYGDWWHCHPRFLKRIEEDYGGVHPNIKKRPEVIIKEHSDRIEDIKKSVKDVVVIWQSEVVKHYVIKEEVVVELIQQRLGRSL